MVTRVSILRSVVVGISWFALAVLLAAVVGVVAWETFRLREPVYQGKRLSVWIKRYAESSHLPNQDRATQEAEIAIRHIGTNGLPTMLVWAGRRDSPFKKRILMLMDVRSKLQVFPADASHSLAGYGFGVLKSIAKPAVPGLIKLLNDTDPEVRYGAAMCLGQIGPAGEKAVPALVQRLDDPEMHRSKVFAALCSVASKRDVVVPVLIGYLSSTNIGDQYWALSNLSVFGADAKTAIPKVLKFLDAPKPYLREAATNTLKNIDPEAAARAGVK